MYCPVRNLDQSCKAIMLELTVYIFLVLSTAVFFKERFGDLIVLFAC